MGCATSKITLQGSPPSNNIHHKFWPLRPSNCSKMENISINMKKPEDDTMLIMERESNFSEHNLLGHDSDKSHSVDQLKNETTTHQRISASSCPLPKKIDNCNNNPCSNELVSSRQVETNEELKRENQQVVTGHVLSDHTKPREGDNVKRLTSFAPSLSFKVYVLKLNGEEKTIDGIEKEPKLEKIMENEEHKLVEQSNLQECQNNEESTSSNQSSVVGKAKLVKKPTIGNKFRKAVPKTNFIPVKLIFKASGLYNINKFRSVSKSENKSVEVNNGPVKID